MMANNVMMKGQAAEKCRTEQQRLALKKCLGQGAIAQGREVQFTRVQVFVRQKIDTQPFTSNFPDGKSFKSPRVAVTPVSGS